MLTKKSFNSLVLLNFTKIYLTFVLLRFYYIYCPDPTDLLISGFYSHHVVSRKLLKSVQLLSKAVRSVRIKAFIFGIPLMRWARLWDPDLVRGIQWIRIKLNSAVIDECMASLGFIAPPLNLGPSLIPKLRTFSYFGPPYQYLCRTL